MLFLLDSVLVGCDFLKLVHFLVQSILMVFCILVSVITSLHFYFIWVLSSAWWAWAVSLLILFLPFSQNQLLVLLIFPVFKKICFSFLSSAAFRLCVLSLILGWQVAWDPCFSEEACITLNHPPKSRAAPHTLCMLSAICLRRF